MKPQFQYPAFAWRHRSTVVTSLSLVRKDRPCRQWWNGRSITFFGGFVCYRHKLRVKIKQFIGYRDLRFFCVVRWFGDDFHSIHCPIASLVTKNRYLREPIYYSIFIPASGFRLDLVLYSACHLQWCAFDGCSRNGRALIILRLNTVYVNSLILHYAVKDGYNFYSHATLCSIWEQMWISILTQEPVDITASKKRYSGHYRSASVGMNGYLLTYQL